VVVDRIVVREGMQQRLAESFETALGLAQGIAIAEYADIEPGETEAKRINFSANFACPVSGFSIPEIEPRLFSFNNPFGACPSCDGLGEQLKIDAAMIVPDKDLGLLDGAIAPWAKSTSPYQTQTLQALAAHYKFDLTKPWNKLPEKIQDIILHGTGDEEIQFLYDDGMRTYKTKKTFEGVIPNLDRRYRETDSAWVREEIARFQSAAPCPACGGKRLKPQALAVKIAGLDISQAGEFSIRKAGDWFGGVNKTLTKQQKEIAARILKEINDRLNFLNSGLTGVLYVLDEPSIGLHQRDNERLLVTLRRLRDLGNSVIVVEHDEDAILTADHVIDMGPAAGVHGGQIIAEGTPAEVMANPKSLTADYLNGTREIAIPKRRPVTKGSRSLVVKGATGNNLKNVTASIPLGTFTCVTGVSGGGKSTLIIETLYKALARKLNGSSDSPAPYASLEGLQHLDKVIDIDQSPIGRTPRSNPATYTGAFGPIRDWYAGLPEAKARGYAPGRFSFNVKGGRCEACQGDGVIKIEMHFLPDVYVTCETCKGKRYNRETLDVHFKGKSIADVLDMTVEDGAKFFAAVPAIASKLDTLNQVGLGYVKVGQQATTLSGGEAQRVKLAKELSKRATGRTLYILDEPTTGLHFEDVKKLLEVLHELVDAGNTIVVIEHNLDVVKTADWVLDLGPEGGDGGGMLIAAGTPEDIAAIPESHTGRFLAETFRRHDERRAQRNKREKAAAKTVKDAPAEKAKQTKKSKAGAGAK